MKSIRNLLLASICIFIISFSCNDPLEIGADLIQENPVDLFASDTFTIIVTTIEEDSVLSHTSISPLASHIYGKIDEPIFGTTTADLFLQPLKNIFAVNPDFQSDLVYDSAVLFLQYDTLLFYAPDPTEEYEVEFRLVDEVIPFTDSVYTNASTSSSLFASDTNVKFTPNFKDSTDVISVQSGVVDTVRTFGILPIKIPDVIAQKIIALDDEDFATPESFKAVFPGLHLKPISINRGILGFDLSSTNSRLSIFYSESDVKKQYDFFLNSANLSTTYNTIVHDYTGREIEPFIDVASKGEDFVFVQGGSGTLIKIEVPYVRNISDAVINQALIEITHTTLAGDDPDLYPVPNQLFVFTDGERGLETVEDITTAIDRGDLGLFGGNPIETQANGQTITRYTFNISAHLQEMIDGAATNTIYIGVVPKPTDSKRGVFFGSKHDTNPLKVSITYSRL